MRIEARYAKKKDLSQYLPSSVLNRGRGGALANVAHMTRTASTSSVVSNSGAVEILTATQGTTSEKNSQSLAKVVDGLANMEETTNSASAAISDVNGVKNAKAASSSKTFLPFQGTSVVTGAGVRRRSLEPTLHESVSAPVLAGEIVDGSPQSIDQQPMSVESLGGASGSSVSVSKSCIGANPNYSKFRGLD